MQMSACRVILLPVPWVIHMRIPSKGTVRTDKADINIIYSEFTFPIINTVAKKYVIFFFISSESLILYILKTAAKKIRIENLRQSKSTVLHMGILL